MKTKITKCLFNAQGKFRNGWWIAFFIGLIAASRPLFSALNQFIKSSSYSELLIEPVPFIFILLITWFCLKLRKEPLRDLGLGASRSFFKLLGVGCLIGSVQITLVVSCIWLFSDMSFAFNSVLAPRVLLISLYSMIFAVLMEELLFRGFLFQRAIDGLGIVWAQIVFAILFSVGHVSDPELSASVTIWAGLDIAIGAMVFGMAYIKTRSLALPIGLHFGWNWFHGDILGFAVSGQTPHGLLTVTQQSPASFLNGGTYGPEASVFAVLSELLVLFLIWRWKGTSN